MKPVLVAIFFISIIYALILFAVSAHGGLPAGMHLATDTNTVRIDTPWYPNTTRFTRALDSLDSIWQERRKK